ncbi:MAG: hypothetical protein KHX55_04115 [Proteobacteria bacterium]|nr:hypothetical protein [Pseudomonadota bacterium]
MMSDRKVKITIKPSPSSATVKLNGQTRTSLLVKPGSVVTWSVTASGYIGQSGSMTVEADIVKSVTLKNRTTTIAVSSATATKYGDERITGSAYMAYGQSYRFSYSFIKGRSYTIQYATSYGVWVYEAFTSTGTGVNTTTSGSKGKPTTVTQQIFSNNNGKDGEDGLTINKTFTASANAAYLFVNNKSTSVYPTVGSIKIIDNS